MRLPSGWGSAGKPCIACWGRPAARGLSIAGSAACWGRRSWGCEGGLTVATSATPPGSIRGEPIADALLGQQVTRLGGVRLDLAPQARHENAQVVRLLHVVRSPDPFEKEPVREHFA